MTVRRSQVEKIKKARLDFIKANEPDGTRKERARANAVLNSLLKTSSEEEHRQAYRELPNS
jgi:hypothetical protein